MSVQGHSSDDRSAQEGMSLRSRIGLVLAGFLAIAGALLFTEHQAHVLGAGVLAAAACPSMHRFMHGGHGHGGHQHDGDRRPS